MCYVGVLNAGKTKKNFNEKTISETNADICLSLAAFYDFTTLMYVDMMMNFFVTAELVLMYLGIYMVRCKSEYWNMKNILISSLFHKNDKRQGIITL